MASDESPTERKQWEVEFRMADGGLSYTVHESAHAKDAVEAAEIIMDRYPDTYYEIEQVDHV